MSSDGLGLTAAVSIALGGMIGGGIYAVLGVVASLTGPATWAAFALAGSVAGCAGYSFVILNAIDEEHDGGRSVSSNGSSATARSRARSAGRCSWAISARWP